jgi:hypothetical protein
MKPDQNKTGVSKMAAAVSSRTNFRIVTAIFTASTAAVTSAASFAWKPKKIAGQAAPRASCQPQACIAELWTAFPAGLRWVIAAMRSKRHAATAMSPYRIAKTPQAARGIGFGGANGGGVNTAYQSRILAKATLAEAMPASPVNPIRPSSAPICSFGAGQYSNPS